MALEWLPRDNDTRNHILIGPEHWGTEAPCTVYEKKPLIDPNGKEVPGLYVAWIRLNNPKQYNSYTTEMVKGVIAGFENASLDRSVVAVVFTGTGPYAFCTGGNTKEYAEYYSMRPTEYGLYMDLFNGMVDGILDCKKPVICRVNGMRVAGGQEIGPHVARHRGRSAAAQHRHHVADAESLLEPGHTREDLACDRQRVVHLLQLVQAPVARLAALRPVGLPEVLHDDAVTAPRAGRVALEIPQQHARRVPRARPLVQPLPCICRNARRRDGRGGEKDGSPGSH